MEKKEIWDKVSRPPTRALKQIFGGRLKGMTDINPQWRYEIMTETFGPCGVGWYYEIEGTWTEPGSDGQVLAFARISLFTMMDTGEWSRAIPGLGGSMLITKEKSGLHSSDEAFKMAITDALSVAMKMLGVASDIYAGLWDGSKYRDAPEKKQTPKGVPADTTEKATPAEEAKKDPPREHTIRPMNRTQAAKIKWLCEQKQMGTEEHDAMLAYHLAGGDATEEWAEQFIADFDENYEKYLDSAVRE